MCSSSSSCLSTLLSLHLPCKTRLSHPIPISADQPRNPRRRRLSSVSASITRKNLELSWVSPDRRDVEDYNGWSFVEQAVIPKKHKKGPPTFLLLGIGTSIVALLAVFARFTLLRKGFVLRFSNPLHVFGDNKSLGSDETSKVDTESVHEEADESAEEVTDHIKLEEGKAGRIVVPFYADATQQEALLLLKNLKFTDH